MDWKHILLYALVLGLATASHFPCNVRIEWNNNGRKPVKLVLKSKISHLPYYLKPDQTHFIIMAPNEAYVGLVDRIELHWEDDNVDIFNLERDSFVEERGGDRLLRKTLYLNAPSTTKVSTEGTAGHKARL